MKRGTRGMVFLMFYLMLLLGTGVIFAGPVGAEVNVNIGVFPPPPPLVIPRPPAMAVVPATPYVYYAPDVRPGLFFHAGHWYRPHDGHWFRARSYRGPWRYVEDRSMPPAIMKLPRGYGDHRDHRKVPYSKMTTRWRSWERERHWDDKPNRPHNVRSSRPQAHRGSPGRATSSRR